MIDGFSSPPITPDKALSLKPIALSGELVGFRPKRFRIGDSLWRPLNSRALCAICPQMGKGFDPDCRGGGSFPDMTVCLSENHSHWIGVKLVLSGKTFLAMLPNYPRTGKAKHTFRLTICTRQDSGDNTGWV